MLSPASMCTSGIILSCDMCLTDAPAHKEAFAFGVGVETEWNVLSLAVEVSAFTLGLHNDCDHFRCLKSD